MTNEERLKSMTTAEMADMLDDLTDSCMDCVAHAYCEGRKSRMSPCIQIIGEWLQQPYAEGNR